LQNFKFLLKKCILPSILLFLLVPYIYGTEHLNSEKTAECFGKMITLIGLPMFIPILNPEQELNTWDILFIKKFSYKNIILTRIFISTIASLVMIYCFGLYMLYKGCEFPIVIYTIRTWILSIFIGGLGLLANVLSGNIFIGFLFAFGCIFFLHENLGLIVFNGIERIAIL